MFLRGSVDLGKLWLYAVIIRFCKLNWKQIGENLYVLSSIIWNFSFAEMHFVHSCDVDTVQVQVNLSKVLYATHKNSRKNMVENSEIAGKIVMLWLSTKRNYCDSNYATFRLPWCDKKLYEQYSLLEGNKNENTCLVSNFNNI